MNDQPQYPTLGNTAGLFYDAFSVGSNVVAGTLASSLVTYSNWPAESFSVAAGMVAGTLALGLVTYSNYAPESFSVSSGIVGGTLT